MFPLEFKLIAGVLLLLAVFATVKHEISEHDAAVKAQVEAAHSAADAKEADAIRLQQNEAALRYEDWKIAQQPRVVVITRKIHDAVQSVPVWASEPIPASVRDAITAAITGPAFAASEPASAVPASPAASGNQR